MCLANALAKRAGLYTRKAPAEQVDEMIRQGAELFDLNDADIAQLVEQVQPAQNQNATARPPS